MIININGLLWIVIHIHSFYSIWFHLLHFCGWCEIFSSVCLNLGWALADDRAVVFISRSHRKKGKKIQRMQLIIWAWDAFFSLHHVKLWWFCDAITGFCWHVRSIAPRPFQATQPDNGRRRTNKKKWMCIVHTRTRNIIRLKDWCFFFTSAAKYRSELYFHLSCFEY